MTATAEVPVRLHAVLDHLIGKRWRGANVEQLHSGANLVLKLTVGHDRLAVRIPRSDDAALQVDRRSELAALRIAARAGLGPDVVAAETRSGLLVTRWLEGEVLQATAARDNSTIDSIARLLRTLHALSAAPAVRRLELPELIDRYLDRLAATGDPAIASCRELRAAALHLLAGDTGPRVLCHCDPHHRNIVVHDHVRLLDWEYAGIGHPLFDLAAYASYHGLDAAASTRLLESYGAGMAPWDASTLERWRWIFDYVCLLWLRASTGSGADIDRPIDSASLLTRLLSERERYA